MNAETLFIAESPAAPVSSTPERQVLHKASQRAKTRPTPGWSTTTTTRSPTSGHRKEVVSVYRIQQQDEHKDRKATRIREKSHAVYDAARNPALSASTALGEAWPLDRSLPECHWESMLREGGLCHR
jgi:hypothetical protein